MQYVTNTFTVEEKSLTRKIAHGLLVSWKKDYTASVSVFTIGVSTIGGGDVIPYANQAALSWQRYRYFDESDYVMDMGYERMLNFPAGGIAKGLADFRLANNPEPDFGWSLSHDGTDDFTQITSSFQPSTTAMSFAFWFYKEAADSNDRVLDWAAGGPSGGFEVLMSGTGANSLQFHIYNGAAQTANMSSSALEPRRWYLVIGTYQSNSANWYIDNILQASDTSVTMSTPAAQSVTIARRSSGSSNFSKVRVQKLRFWNRVLTSDERAALLSGAYVPSSPQVELLFNRSNLDTSGNDFHATITGATYVNNSPLVEKVGLNKGRFTPHYMGGDSELYTAILPRRPIIINAGFNYGGVDNLLGQFIGITTKQPRIDQRAKRLQFEAADFIDFLENRYLDQTTMFTGLRTDQVIENVLSGLGYSTADYELDMGHNTISFGLIEKGKQLGNLIDELVKAEQGHFYQDEKGKLIFTNRTRWGRSPYNTVQKVISTAQVISFGTDAVDHIVNVVEVRSQPRVKQPQQLIWQSNEIFELPVGDTTIFVDFEDPILAANAPSITVNTMEDGTGTDVTSSISLKSSDLFATSAKYVFTNPTSTKAFITQMDIYGRPAKVSFDLYYRQQDDSSVTAYEERPLVIENNYIQTEDWARSLAGQILDEFAEPERLQSITIRAMPELQLGDFISWQGRYWTIYGCITRVDPDEGFVQDLDLLQRDIVTYFQIGVSTIGGADKIA